MRKFTLEDVQKSKLPAEMKEYLDSMPVYVVCCEKCRHFGRNDENDTYCSCVYGLSDPQNDDFCSYGERRDGE